MTTTHRPVFSEETTSVVSSQGQDGRITLHPSVQQPFVVGYEEVSDTTDPEQPLARVALNGAAADAQEALAQGQIASANPNQSELDDGWNRYVSPHTEG